MYVAVHYVSSHSGKTARPWLRAICDVVSIDFVSQPLHPWRVWASQFPRSYPCSDHGRAPRVCRYFFRDVSSAVASGAAVFGKSTSVPSSMELRNCSTAAKFAFRRMPSASMTPPPMAAEFECDSS